MSVVAAPTWNGLRTRIAVSDRSSALSTAATWAFDVLERELPAQWLARASKQDPRLFVPLEHSPESLPAVIELVQWALRLDVTRELPGYDRVLRTIKTDIHSRQYWHYRIQLELAALAQGAGYRAEMEPPGEPPADVDMQTNEHRIRFEVRAALRGERLVQVDELADRIRNVVGTQDAQVTGSVHRVLTDADIDDILNRIEEHLRLAAISVFSPPIRVRGATFQVTFGAGKQPVQVHANVNHWRDLESKLAHKIEQTRQSGATWIRVDWSSEVWKLEHFGLGFAKRAEAMYEFLHPLLARADHLHGIVVTDGAVLTCPDVLADEHLNVGTDARAIGVCNALPGIRRRESVVAARTPEFHAEASAIADLYAAEASWLPTALATRELDMPPEFVLSNLASASSN